ncbi:uncharacterized protein METZ01_LOCUS263223 [marine metagenome]|uniref:Thioredoxin domain-containing protein n=1 Tax=marine metagenome TaxID=408172 RepID=A0A382JFC9_9ZZZZ
MLTHSKKMFQLILAVLLPLSIYGAETEEANWRIVNYWSEWCAPCRIEIPMFNELSEQLSSSNVRIVGVNFDEDPREVTLDIADELGIEFPTLTLEQVEELALRPPDIMPTTYILSPTNEVAAKLIGMQSKADILGQLMQLGLTVQSN